MSRVPLSVLYSARRILLTRGSLSSTPCSSSTTNGFVYTQHVELHSSMVQLKEKERPKKEKKKSASSSINISAIDEDEGGLMKRCLKDMQSIEDTLADELTRHFSLQVDLRQYEQLLVKTEKGDEHRMSHLGRVSLKTPHMVMINFADNPTVIKAAKLALEKSALNVNPQQQGVVLYVPTPKMTRERREQMAHDAKKILNEYKQALNELYSKMDKANTKENGSKEDLLKKIRQALLQMKKTFEQKGAEHVEVKQKELMKEVA